MRKLIESSVASLERKLVLVAPPQARCEGFTNAIHDPARHRRLLHEMQRLRGGIFLDDGAIARRDLTADGRHALPEDDPSWHLLMTDTTGQVRACVLLLLHEHLAAFQHLRVRRCPLLQRAESRHQVQCAVESEMARARDAGLRFGELGGWAISRERRGSPDGLMMTLAAYGLARMLGGALCITTANARSSSPILRRLGGAYLEFNEAPIPSYFDPRYNHEMDLLRFDSRSPHPKYAALVEMVIGALSKVALVVGSSHTIAHRPQPAALSRDGYAA
jgi:hypothetical protein